MDKLFVYGSLQPGGPNEHVLAVIGGRWQPGTVRGHLRKLGWGAGIGYPGLVLDDDGDEVRGYVFFSPGLKAAWDALDRFEGDEYERVLAPISLLSGLLVDANVYVLRCA